MGEGSAVAQRVDGVASVDPGSHRRQEVEVERVDDEVIGRGL